MRMIYNLLMISLGTALVAGGGAPATSRPDPGEFQPACTIGAVDTTGVVGLAGMAASRDHPGLIYTINFHTNTQRNNIIHVIEARTGQTRGSVTVVDMDPSSWADMAVGPCSESDSSNCIYILGDTSILKLREPADPYQSSSGTVEENIVINNVGQQSLFVGLNGLLYFMDSVNYGDGISLYTINRTNLAGVTRKTINIPSASPGPKSADLSPDGRELLVLMADNAVLFVIADNNIAGGLSRQPEILPTTPFPTEFKLTWSPSGRGYYLGTGNSLMSEVKLFYSARCNDITPEPETFQEGRVVGTVSSNVLGRISGMAASRKHPGSFYLTVTGEAVVYVIATDGTLTATFQIGNSNNNMKDVAVGACQTGSDTCVYLINDNQKIVSVFPEPEVLSNQTLTLEQITFISSVFMFFSRSLMVAPNSTIYLLEWEFQNYVTGVNVFELYDDAGWKAETVGTFFPQSAREGPEAGDMSPDGSEILVKMRDRVLLFRVTEDDVRGAFVQDPEYLPYLPERRGNSIAWSHDASSYYTVDSETMQLYQYDRISMKK